MQMMKPPARWRLLAFFLPLVLMMACSLGGKPADDEPDREQPEPAPGEASVSGMAWLDADRDGIQDEEEVGLADVSVELRSTEGEPGDRTVTDDDGAYRLEAIPAGEYQLVFTPLEGYEFSPQDVGEDDRLDSDPDVGTGETDPFRLSGADSLEDWDAGLYNAQEPPPPPPPPPTDTPEPTPLILIPGGEYFYRGAFTNGSGNCMANAAPFQVPNLIVRIEGTDMELDQPGMHLNTGSVVQEDGSFSVSTGEGPNTEAYDGTFDSDLSATGTYRYTTAAGTCMWDFALELVPQ